MILLLDCRLQSRCTIKLIMESLPRNGSYVQRRKMYVEFPLHNMKSKVPIDWDSDQQPTYERHRQIAKETNEREYIKRIYDQKMERKLKERYRGGGGGEMRNEREAGIEDGREALMKQIDEFNTSKVNPTASSRNNNPENAQPRAEPYTPSVSSKKGERYQKEEEAVKNDRERRYSERQRSYESEKDRNRQKDEGYSNSNGSYGGDRPGYNYNGGIALERSYNQLQHSPRGDPYGNPNNQYPSPLNRGQSDLSSNPYRPPYYISAPRYKPPYQDQNQYSYDAIRQTRPQYHPELPPGHINPHPFRNNLPDRLEEFLREKTKADRKSAIMVSLKDR